MYTHTNSIRWIASWEKIAMGNTHVSFLIITNIECGWQISRAHYEFSSRLKPF